MNKKSLFSTALLFLFSSMAYTQYNEELLTVNDVNSNLTTYASSEEITHNGIILSLDNEKMEATVKGVYSTDDNFEHEAGDSYYIENVLVLKENVSYNEFYKIVRIDIKALKGNTELTTVLSDTKTMTIEEGAFEGCTNLIYTSFKADFMTIKAGAFDGCLNLGSAQFLSEPTGTQLYSGSITFANAFNGADNLKVVLIECGTLQFGERTFSGSPFETFVVRCSELNIGTEALANCLNLNDVRINSEKTVIGNSAFYGNSSLSSFTLPPGVSRIGDMAYANCANLGSFKFANTAEENSTESGRITVTEKDSKSITVRSGEADGLMTISESGFIMPTFGEDIFLNTPLFNIMVPDFALDDFKEALPDYADKIKPYATTSTEFIQGTTLSAYPNPTDGIVKITGLSAGKKVSLFSITGALIKTYIATDDVLTVNIESLVKGMYFIECEGKSVKVIKN